MCFLLRERPYLFLSTKLEQRRLYCFSFCWSLASSHFLTFVESLTTCPASSNVNLCFLVTILSISSILSNFGFPVSLFPPFVSFLLLSILVAWPNDCSASLSFYIRFYLYHLSDWPIRVNYHVVVAAYKHRPDIDCFPLLLQLFVPTSFTVCSVRSTSNSLIFGWSFDDQLYKTTMSRDVSYHPVSSFSYSVSCNPHFRI